ncbi:hypothetical protein FACS189413_13970 [Bacteroidia bacterium]|nr:hypothetical protein FACS189413_13970 [Bacteroidia bacterium]
MLDLSPDKEITFSAGIVSNEVRMQRVKVTTNFKSYDCIKVTLPSETLDWYTIQQSGNFVFIQVSPNKTLKERKAEVIFGAGTLTKTVQITQEGVKNASVPKVRTHAITNLQGSLALSGVTMINDGGLTALRYGICWATTQNPDTTSANLVKMDVPSNYPDNYPDSVKTTVSLTNLSSATTYYVRAFAVNEKGIGYGEEQTITTAQFLPTVSTQASTNITDKAATLNGTVTAAGSATYTKKGFVYSTTANPTLENATKREVAGTAFGTYLANITGLTANTTYYVRAYITNAQGTEYGNIIDFTTLQLAILTTGAATDITTTSATLNATITNVGGPAYTERGFVYATTQNPTTSNTKVVVSGSGTGIFSQNITGLNVNTTYYVRAYAINAQGTAYGNSSNFKTLDYTLSNVTTESATDVTYNSATLNGSVTFIGDPAYTEKGFVYATTQNPTVSNTKKLFQAAKRVIFRQVLLL